MSFVNISWITRDFMFMIVKEICTWFLDRKSGDHQMLIYFKCNTYFWCLELRQLILCGTWLNIWFTFIFRQEWECSYPVKFQCLSCSQGRFWTIMSLMADYQNATSGKLILYRYSFQPFIFLVHGHCHLNILRLDLSITTHLSFNFIHLYY